jgi:hypothetical protein
MVASWHGWIMDGCCYEQSPALEVTCRRASSVLADGLSPSQLTRHGRTATSCADDAVHVHRDLC